ncbi:MAG: DEAD/DEAH box helicase family protein, partial [Archangium sp.]|nr:DEAD/DEAH box helicase family protein [Archangium sp.]
MGALRDLLSTYRRDALTNRESGTYFEELTQRYLRDEPAYADLYAEVLTWAEFAERMDFDKRDTGIDLVAVTRENEFHAVQCKLYPDDYELKKSDIDSFFTASGKKHFSRRIIVSTTNHWSVHAQDALKDQRPPVTKIDLSALENSAIDWAKYASDKQVVFRAKKQLLEHQKQAVKAGLAHFKEADRGKLIMACGTGKTFTSLKIAEEQAGAGNSVLFLVPSLALLSQTLTEWTHQSKTKLHNFAVCSDGEVGKKRRDHDGDAVQLLVHELQYPATTNPGALATEFFQRQTRDLNHMSVVYATYHSIDVIHEAQKKFKLPEFDLVICDEAHRTTGATYEGDDESHFVKVHDPKFLRAKKRLYMTATPRIYGDYAQAIAERDKARLFSMDDEELFGKVFHTVTFSEAVKRDLLVDYKVIVLAVDESTISTRIQKLLDDPTKGLR